MAKSPLRDRRLALGLTQSGLAARAGVSRQAVAAVESGRNTPAVDAALRLAAALDTTVEALFSPPRGQSVEAALTELRIGELVRVGIVGEQLVAAPGGVETADGVVTADGAVKLFDGVVPAGLVVAGCDPVLGFAEQLLADSRGERLIALQASTAEACAALAAGRVHAAVVHGRPGELGEPPVTSLRLRLAAWRVGLATEAGQSLTAALDGQLVQRPAGAASQQALIRAVTALGRELPDGPLAPGHLESARLGATLAIPALANEAAAALAGQAFVPLEEHVVELWLDDRWVSHPGFAALAETLRGKKFIDRAAVLSGYTLQGCGTVL